MPKIYVDGFFIENVETVGFDLHSALLSDKVKEALKDKPPIREICTVTETDPKMILIVTELNDE